MWSIQETKYTMILLPMRFQCKHSLFLISASTVTIEENIGRRKPSELLEVNGIVYFMCLNTLVTRTSSVHRDGEDF